MLGARRPRARPLQRISFRLTPQSRSGYTRAVARTKLDTEATGWNSINSLPSRGAGVAPAAEDIARSIQDLIVSQGLQEGDRVPSERDIAHLLSTSRPTVSQAIRILVTKGLIESRRGSGAYVTNRPLAGLESSVGLMLDLNADSITQLNEFRLWLELTGVLAAVERATEEDLALGEESLRRLVDDVGDVAAWMSADTRFHATLVRASKNPYLTSIYESVHAALINYEYRSWIQNEFVPAWLEAGNADALVKLHQPILDALKSRDPAAVREAIGAHHEAMAEHLARSGADDTVGR